MHYQFQLKLEYLLRLYVTWEQRIVGVLMGSDLPSWGPTPEQIVQARANTLFGGGAGLSDAGEYDVEFEEDADALLVEYLDNIRIVDNYREQEASNVL